MKIAFYHYIWPHLLEKQGKEFKSKISEYLVINNLAENVEKLGQEIIRYSKTPPLPYNKNKKIRIFRDGFVKYFDLLKFILNPPDMLVIVSKSLFHSKSLMPLIRFICWARNVKLMIFLGHDESKTSTKILKNLKPYKYHENNFWDDDKNLKERIKKNNKYRPRHKNEILFVPSSIIYRNCVNEGWPKDQIHILPHGTDINYFQPRKIENEHEQIKILFAGNGATRKGLPYLLKALEMLQQRNYNVHLTIVSHNVEGIKIPRIDIFEDISDDQLLGLYQTHDIFVLPSLLDGWGLTASEAMACGLPVIVSNATGISDIIKSGKNGYIVEPKNHQDIYNKLLILINNRHLRQKIGENARQTIKNFTWDKIGNIFLSLLNKI